MSQIRRPLNFTDLWSKLLEEIERVYQTQTISTKVHAELYTYIYDYCTNTIPQRPSAPAPRSWSRNRNCSIQDAPNIGGEELYIKLQSYLRDHLEKICEKGLDLQGKDLLHFYATNWKQYHLSSRVTNSFCHYFNRYWVRGAYDSGRRDVYEVFHLAMEIWRMTLFQLLNRRVTLACLQLIKAQRNNQIINTQLISDVIQSYIELGFTVRNEPGPNGHMTTPTLTVYKESFESQLLQDIEQFYRLEAATFLVHNAVTKYLKKVSQLDEEVHRARSYLHPTTLPILAQKVENVLIRDQLEAIYAEAKALLRDEKHQDLALLFKLVSRIPEAALELKGIVEEHIRQISNDAFERIRDSALDDPKLYVETILYIHVKFFKLIQEAFGNIQEFTTAIDKACGKFINNNAVTAAADDSTKSPELLARYCDALLRKGSKAVEETDLEEKFNQIMVVFNYVEDKDVFQKFYGKMLAKRLVGQLSVSDDYERSVISKLKNVCGVQYTSDLEQKLRDITISKDLTNLYQTFREREQLTTEIDFSVMTLTSCSWPFSSPLSIVLPIELKSIVDNFTAFYSQQRIRRKLIWLYQHSEGELQTYLTKSNNILHVSTYQMVVLLLFNRKPSWTIQQIQDETQINPELLAEILCTLLKSEVLTCSEIKNAHLDTELKAGAIKLDHIIEINDAFERKKIHVNLDVSLKSVKEHDIGYAQEYIDRDRKMLIQIVIVRIMKARQKLKYAMLMQEVIRQSNTQFKPSIPMIKKCIDILIEKTIFNDNQMSKIFCDICHRSIIELLSFF